MPPLKTLIIQSSARQSQSITRTLSEDLINHLKQQTALDIRVRDLEKTHLALLDDSVMGAFFVPQESQTPEQRQLLQPSIELIDELLWADQLIIASPIYNFSVPARLKAWIDLICRAGYTFKYTDQGPVGLTGIQRAYLIMASGGVPIESDVDFATRYLTHIMSFIGIDDTRVIAASGSKREPEQVLNAAREQIRQLQGTYQ